MNILTNLLPDLYWALLFIVAAIWANVHAYKAGQREGWSARAQWEITRQKRKSEDQP